MLDKIKKALGLNYKEVLTATVPSVNPVDEIRIPVVEQTKQVVIPDPVVSFTDYIFTSHLFEDIENNSRCKGGTLNKEAMHIVESNLQVEYSDLFSKHLKTKVYIINRYYRAFSFVIEIYLNSPISDIYNLSSLGRVKYTSDSNNYKLSLYVDDIYIELVQPLGREYFTNSFIPYCFNYIFSCIIDSNITNKNNLLLNKFASEFENIQDYFYDLELMSSVKPILEISNNQMVFSYQIDNIKINQVSVTRDSTRSTRYGNVYMDRGISDNYCESITYTPDFLQLVQTIGTTSKRIKDTLPDCDINFKLSEKRVIISIKQPLEKIQSLTNPHRLLSSNRYMTQNGLNNVGIGRQALMGYQPGNLEHPAFAGYDHLGDYEQYLQRNLGYIYLNDNNNPDYDYT